MSRLGGCCVMEGGGGEDKLVGSYEFLTTPQPSDVLVRVRGGKLGFEPEV